MKNARFWIFINDAPAKITLKPGQALSHYQGGATDEGWQSTAETWELSTDAQTLTREHISDGADCDGRLTRGCDSIASADPATFSGLYYTPELMRPDWQDADQYQRDQFAEMAGY